jgi:hypothetical protein
MAGRALAGGTSSKDRGGSKMKAPEGNSGAFARSDPQVRSRRDKTATIDDRRGCVARASQRMVRTRKGARLAGPDLRVRTRLHLRSRRLGPGLRDRSGTLTLQFLRQLLPARIGDDFDRSFAQHRRNRGAAVLAMRRKASITAASGASVLDRCPTYTAGILTGSPRGGATKASHLSRLPLLVSVFLRLHDESPRFRRPIGVEYQTLIRVHCRIIVDNPLSLGDSSQASRFAPWQFDPC